MYVFVVVYDCTSANTRVQMYLEGTSTNSKRTNVDASTLLKLYVFNTKYANKKIIDEY